MRLLCVLLVSLLGHQHASADTFDCFTVVDPRGEVVYKSNRSPVDLSKKISEAMAAYPGHHLVWSRSDEACAGVDRLKPRENVASPGAPAPQAPTKASARTGRAGTVVAADTRRSAAPAR